MASVTVFLGNCTIAASGLNPKNDQETLRYPSSAIQSGKNGVADLWIPCVGPSFAFNSANTQSTKLSIIFIQKVVI
jgi:hypothetical protein